MKMKILIVDDEALTRQGIIDNISWATYHFDHPYEADDGMNGIHMARTYKPNIIISDIKMPRMNGIQMMREINQFLPNVSIIFMSAYSDKDYLKAAIFLKAVNYIEKPIDLKELEEAIVSSVDQQTSYQNHQFSLQRMTEYHRKNMILSLLQPLKKDILPFYYEEFQSMGYMFNPSTYFITITIYLKNLVLHFEDTFINNFIRLLDKTIIDNSISYLYSIKNENYLILTINSNENILEASINKLLTTLTIFISPYSLFYMSIGNVVRGIDSIYESYSNSLFLIQSSFFYPYNHVIWPNDHISTIPIKLFEDCMNAIASKNKAMSYENAELILEKLKDSQRILPSVVMNYYYNLYKTIMDTSHRDIVEPLYSTQNSNIMDFLSKGWNLYELHQDFNSKLDQLFTSQESSNSNNNSNMKIIHEIKDYINNNYRNELLSVKDISEHVYLSSSYVCTIFKQYTGKTLNQYLTEYRMGLAKEYLKDLKYTITDISSLVGYSDSNYFGKSFKKIVGTTPSDYREKNV